MTHKGASMNRKYIALRQAEYNALTRAKTVYEKANGGSTDWGAFLLLLLGLAAGAPLFNEWLSNQQQTKTKQEGGEEDATG